MYIAGDVAPFRWFNAGDFGDGSLMNNDLLQVFESAVYVLHLPPDNSDFGDAMDACNDSSMNWTNLAEGNDTTINSIALGDGRLNVADVYVVFRRSLDPSLTNYARFWSNGVRQAVAVSNLFRGKPYRPAERYEFKAADLPAEAQTALNSTESPSVRFFADDLQVQPGQVVEVPVRADIAGKYPVRVVMFNLNVQPLDGSPKLTEPVQFVPATGLGQPTFSDARGAANYSAAWLNSQSAGVWGDGRLGTLYLKVPETATDKAAYRVEITRVSASPNGLAVFPQQVQAGVLSTSDRSTSSWNDDIPDAWRLRYFGSVNNLLSHANADADGDGVPNRSEFKAGTDPSDVASLLRLRANRADAADASAKPVLRWPTAPGKKYIIESAPSLGSDTWTPLAPDIQGTGHEVQFTDHNAGGAPRFYRVRLQE